MSRQSVKPELGGGTPDSPLLPLEEARRRMYGALGRIEEVERVSISDALGRICAEDVVSPIDVPGHTNSALDGYAVRGDDLARSGDKALELIGTSWAGKSFPGEVSAGEAVRIMTGAAMPRGADTVVAQEQAESDGSHVRIGAGHRRGQNVRQVGEDLARGEVALAAGLRLMPAELGLLASLGLGQIAVRRRLRVAIFSTGDELRDAGEPREDATVYDSNRFTLHGMLTRLGAEVLDRGIVRDTRDAVRAAVLTAAGEADVVISSGGVSTGEADFVQDVLAGLGEVVFWRVAIKPGRPIAFARLADTLFFGLPGNPVAVMVTFYQFLQPALLRMMGVADPRPVPLMKAVAASRLEKRAGRTEFYRAVLERDEHGELVVRRTGRQGSGVLHSMSEANCFVILPDDCETVEAGTTVDVQPFFGLV